MEMRAWAHAVLFGSTLEEKLRAPEAWTDDEPGPALPIPDAPGRPAGLGFREERAAFPGAHELHRPEARGRVLHFFANHELLALELFALALLRFPDAPRRFRRGVAGILVEEQRHLAGYLDRMRDTGVSFGDLPLNRYFWSALAAAPSEVSFLAGIALTFEQANLDHAGWWAAAFRRVGDEPTAAALDVVLADEIGHVRHGLAWFDRWRDPTRTRWQAWTELVPPPLTPARAKGPGFSRRARLAAGLDEATIEELAAFGASKGRPPVVHLFEPGVEEALATGQASPTADRVAEDLAPLQLFLAGGDDVVLAPRRPSTSWLATLADAGFPLPEVKEWRGEPVADVLGDRKIGRWAPWARSPAFAAWTGEAWSPAWAALYSKTWGAERLAELVAATGEGGPAGTVCRTPAEVEAAVAAGLALKAPLSTAGRGIRRPGDPHALAWGLEILAAQGAVVAEPWLDRVADLSIQLDVAADGSVSVERYGRFLTDARGQYLGAVLGRPLAGLPADVLRFAHGEGRDPELLQRRLAAAARHVGAALHAAGYAGPAGIDALIHRADGAFHLRPIVEVNPRVTMGCVALALQRHLRGGRVGLWRHVSVAALRRRGIRDVAAWALARSEAAPLRLHGSPPLLDAGLLFTSDPTRARTLVTVLAVAESLDAAAALLPEIAVS